MKTLSLEEIKRKEFDILLTFKRFCLENNITYFLSNGTLLGAVKYQGFIPWDDDIDVFVPREDYDRLIQLFADSEQYVLFSAERRAGFAYPFAKLCDMTTVKTEAHAAGSSEMGLDIDIFPLDAWDDDPAKALQEVKRITALRKGLYFAQADRNRLLRSPTPKNLAAWVIDGVCACLGTSFFIKRIQRIARRSRGDKQFLGCKCWCIYAQREILPAPLFAEATEVMFEGEAFAAPVGYDAYLRSLYGDYTQDPPKEKQRTHHRFTAYLREV